MSSVAVFTPLETSHVQSLLPAQVAGLQRPTGRSDAGLSRQPAIGSDRLQHRRQRPAPPGLLRTGARAIPVRIAARPELAPAAAGIAGPGHSGLAARTSQHATAQAIGAARRALVGARRVSG